MHTPADAILAVIMFGLILWGYRKFELHLEKHKREFELDFHPNLTPDMIPDRRVKLELFSESGVATDIRKNMSYGNSVQEVWYKRSDGREASVEIVGGPPMRRDHRFSVVYDRNTGAMCGVINHNTAMYCNFVPGIEKNNSTNVFMRHRDFFKCDESMISAWGDQNVHVKPKVEAYLRPHM